MRGDLKIIDNEELKERFIEKKWENFSENYVIMVNLGEVKFYECEYFIQEEVDKINPITKKYE